MDSRRSHRSNLVAFIAFAALLLTAGPASAASLSLDGSGVLSFSAGASEENRVTVTHDGVAYVVRDAGVASMSLNQTGGLPCSVLSLIEISCPAVSVSTVNVALGDRDDTLTASGSAPVAVAGDAGADAIAGGAGADTLSGGAGDDEFVGGAGADVVSGGPGADGMDYSAAAVPIAADLDGLPDDGAAGENDNLGADLERLTGGSASDNLAGGVRLDGGDGNDTLTAAPGGTRLLGDGGADTLTGAAGFDEFDGAAGVDQILARDGRAEVVVCGEGVDVVDVDPIDQLHDCDLLPDDPPAGGEGTGDAGATGGDGFGPAPGALGPAPDIVLPPQPVSVTSTPGVVLVTVGCAADAADVCMGEVILELTQRVRVGTRIVAARGRYVARQQRVGRRRYRVGQGKRMGVRIRLNARGHAIMRSRRRARGRIRVRQHNRAGQLLGETTRPVSFTARKWGRRPPRRGSRSR